MHGEQRSISLEYQIKPSPFNTSDTLVTGMQANIKCQAFIVARLAMSVSAVCVGTVILATVQMAKGNDNPFLLCTK